MNNLDYNRTNSIREMIEEDPNPIYLVSINKYSLFSLIKTKYSGCLLLTTLFYHNIVTRRCDLASCGGILQGDVVNLFVLLHLTFVLALG